MHACSKGENEGVVEEFLSGHGDFQTEAFQLPPVGTVGKAAMATLWPHRHGMDGLFYLPAQENHMKTDIKSLLPEEISGILQEMGEASYRGKQVFQWLHRGAVTFEDMTNLPKNLRAKLEERFFYHRAKSHQQAGFGSRWNDQIPLGPL